MPEMPDTESLKSILYLIVPGLIITYVRSMFLMGRMQSHSESILSYFILSSIYWSVVFSTSISMETIEKYILVSVLIIFIIPSISGLTIGVFSQKGFFRNYLTNRINSLLRMFKKNADSIHIQHPVNTAWDYVFLFGPSYVCVNLLNGNKVYGCIHGEECLASSDQTERDLIVKSLDSSEKLTLIPSSQIETIDFFQGKDGMMADRDEKGYQRPEKEPKTEKGSEQK